MPHTAGLLGWGELLLGRPGDALRHLDRGLAAARAAGNVLALPDLLVGRSMVLRSIGRLADSADAALGAAELAAASGSGQQLVLSLAARCWTAVWTGDQSLALHAGAASIARRERPVSRWVLALAHRMYAEARVAAGHGNVAEGLLTALGGPALPDVDPWSRVDVYELLARAALAAGDAAAAAHWADRAESAAGALPSRTGIARLTRAQVLLAEEPAAALAQACTAAALLDEAGVALDAARARLAAGSAAARSGEPEEAAAQLRRAQEVFEACGARPWARQAVAERRRLAGRAPRSVKAGRTALALLTQREQQVAALVSEGLSNRRVAQQLYVAEKTVEMHLSHIFTKLGVGSRTELTRLVMTT
jgi:DNA-binding NarL/FixJ family response regulator